MSNQQWPGNMPPTGQPQQPAQAQPWTGQPQQPAQAQPWTGQPQQPAQAHPNPAAQMGAVAPGQVPSLASAKVGNQQGRPLEADYNYIVEIQDINIVNTYYGLKYIVEFTVLESECPNIRPGDDRSWTRPFADEFGHGPNDIKGHVVQCVELLRPGSQPGVNWSDQFLHEVAPAGTPSPMKGSRWHGHAWGKPKKNPKPGRPDATLIVDWRPAEPGETLGGAPPPSPPPSPPPPPPPPPQGIPARPAGWPEHMAWPPVAG